MKRISEIYRPSHLGISIEIYPPKEPRGDRPLFLAIERLSRHKPDFISCTYGAGGSTRVRTLEICEKIQEKFPLQATAHITCIGSTREQLIEWLSMAKQMGIANLMALRGDLPKNEKKPPPNTNGPKYGNEMVAFIKEQFPDFGIGVAGYPEVHNEAKDAQADIHYLKQKVEAGADAVFTQLFYDNSKFFEFAERYDKAGIHSPLIPGIMPITDYTRIKNIVDMSGTSFPKKLREDLEKAQGDRAAQLEIGVAHTVAQCEELIKNGVPGIHFYALNVSKACRKVLTALGR